MKKMTSLQGFVEEALSAQHDKKQHLYLCVQKETEVSYGIENDCDLEYCDQHNIPYFNRGLNGGCIVHAKGNVEGGAIYSVKKYGELYCCNQFIKDFISYLYSKNIKNITTEHNDILIDGYKVASATGGLIAKVGDIVPPEGFMSCEFVQISINQDIELIEKVCKKPMVKVPKALSDYGITTEEVATWLENWLKETFNKSFD